MTNTPNFERIVRAVRHEEPDRIPLIEVLVEYPVQSAFLGREVTDEDIASQVEFWTRAGYDYVPLVAGMMTPGKVTQNSNISKVLRENVSSEPEDDRSWNLEYTSFISDRRDFEAFPWEEAAKIDLSKFRAIAPLLPDGMKVIVVSGKLFTLSSMLMGFDNFAMSLLTDEQLVADVMAKVAEIQFSAIRQTLELPYVGAVWAVDDIACGTGTMISPQALREHLFPYYKRIARECHDKGRLFFYHSDGDMRPIMEDMISIGVDALHPIDPTALDITRMKETYGGRIALFGNVSTELLRSGTPDEVRETVKELLRTVAPRGGYCLGSGNSVPEWVDLANYNAMRETVLQFGMYPIRVD